MDRIPIGTLCLVLQRGDFPEIVGMTGTVVGFIKQGTMAVNSYGLVTHTLTSEEYEFDIPSHPPPFGRTWAMCRHELLPIDPTEELKDEEIREELIV